MKPLDIFNKFKPDLWRDLWTPTEMSVVTKSGVFDKKLGQRQPSVMTKTGDFKPEYDVLLTLTKHFLIP